MNEKRLETQGGFGYSKFQTDRSIHYLEGDCTMSRATFTPKSGYYTSDCDDLSEFPIPTNGALEGETGWAVGTCSGDCHLIVYDTDSGLLWESWDTEITAMSNGIV